MIRATLSVVAPRGGGVLWRAEVLDGPKCMVYSGMPMSAWEHLGDMCGPLVGGDQKTKFILGVWEIMREVGLEPTSVEVHHGG